jgi:hypothetical protein
MKRSKENHCLVRTKSQKAKDIFIFHQFVHKNMFERHSSWMRKHPLQPGKNKLRGIPPPTTKNPSSTKYPFYKGKGVMEETGLWLVSRNPC